MTTFNEWIEGAGSPWTEIWTYINKGTGDAPCCHWGRRDWENVALFYCGAALAEGACLCDDCIEWTLDPLIGKVVNDSDGICASLIIRYRHRLPSGWTEWVDVEEFASATRNEGVVAQVAAVILTISKICAALRDSPLSRERFDITYGAGLPVAWDIVFDYHDEREG